MDILTSIRFILHVNEKLGHFGGTEEYIQSIAQILSRYGASSSVVYGDRKGEIPASIDSHYFIPELANRRTTSDISEKLRAIVRRSNPDLIYIHNVFNEKVVRALDIPKRPFSIFWYIHDHYLTCLTELRAHRQQDKVVCRRKLSDGCLTEIEAGNCIKRYSEQSYSVQDLSARESLLRSLEYVDAIIVISKFMKDVLVENIPDVSNRIYVLPRQVRKPRILNSYSITNSRRVSFVGRITYEKGLHISLDALEMLPKNLQLRFKIAGVIENQRYWDRCVQQIKRLHSSHGNISIEYLGFLSYDEVDRLYSETDILVVPSVWGEPSATVAAEALLHGSAVIASNVGGVSTFIKDLETGILVTPDDPQALADALYHLLTNEELRRNLASRGNALISDEFTEELHVQKLVELIRMVREQAK